MARLLSFLLALGSLAAAGSSASADWSADLLALPAPVTDVRQAGDTVYIKADSWFQVSICDGREICLMPGEPPAIARPPDGIPDGTIAAASRLDIVHAWYSEPTDRYGHGILGDRVEAGALVAVDAAGRRYTMSLGPGFAFEDLAPRIVDLDEDRMAEIVTIRTDINAGAAIAIYGIRDGGLAEIAAMEPIGMPNRWLNIAGIADLTGDGRLDIALVKTPHIGGRLEVWTFRSGSLTRLASAEGFANHIIGSTELHLSAIADADGDGVLDLALPNAGRTALRIVSVVNGAISNIAVPAVDGRIETGIGVLSPPGRPIFLMGLEDGRAVAIKQN